VKTIRIFLSLLLALTMLQGCGSKGSSGSSPADGSVRLVNATTAYASLDMTTSGPITLATAVATGSASTYAAIAPGTYPFSLDVSGSGTPSAQQALLISSSVTYALVAHTSGGQLQLTALTENEVAPASGDGKLRVSNLALQDTGGVDVYMTGSGGTLSSASALVTNLGVASGYFEIPQGTYHIWVTGVANKADLRLDLPSVVISNQQVLTLVLTATTGGVLVDGWLITQQAAVSAQTNASARVRVAANIVLGSVVATANGVSLDSSTLVSPAVDTYALVPAGALSTSVVVNGTTFNVPNLNAAAGADLTLLAIGTVAAPQFFLLSDDNRLPLSGRAKLRLVNGVNGLAGNISLTADANLVAQNVALGTASAAATVATTGNNSQLQVNGPGNAPLSPSNVMTLQSQGVYSVFMLGNNTTPVEIVRADR
jgi:Domain of unknown function (DUF4397)